MNWDDVFNAHGYWPVRCPDHPDHAVNRDDHTGEMLCTSGHPVRKAVTGAELRSRRLERGLSQAALAELSGISVRAIINAEQNAVTSTRETLTALITALGGDPDTEIGPEPPLITGSYLEVDGQPAFQFSLPNGQHALIDAADLELVEGYVWRAKRNSHNTYVQGRKRDGWRKGVERPNDREEVLLHRLLTDAPATVQVDHRNHDGLDNRRSNLRVATPSDNAGNQRLNVRNTSGFKGVHWDAARGKWAAAICFDGKRRHLGRFDTAWEAAEAYNEAAVAQWGEFALVNTPDGLAAAKVLPVVRDAEDRVGDALKGEPA